MKHYAEIRTDYVDESHFDSNADFCYVDTWETSDPNEDGHSVAKVNLETGEVIWHDTNKDVISNPQIMVAIADIIKRFNITI